MELPDKFAKNGDYKKMIFLLTDGETSDSAKCYNIAREKSDHTQIHTFGVGNDCDKLFVKTIAEIGEGTHQIIGSDEVHLLRSKVIQVL